MPALTRPPGPSLRRYVTLPAVAGLATGAAVVLAFDAAPLGGSSGRRDLEAHDADTTLAALRAEEPVPECGAVVREPDRG